MRLLEHRPTSYHSVFTQQFTSPLAPEEIIAILQSKTLPPSNDSWRDGFTVNPAQPFYGTIAADSFRLTRLEGNKPVRRAAPRPLVGYISAVIPNHTSSQVLLSLHPAPMDILTNGVAWALAIFSFAAILVREWPNFRTGNLLYFLLPACFTALSYNRLRNEAKAYEQLLGPLLALTKQA